MIDLNDRRFADDLVLDMDKRVRAMAERIGLRLNFGVVDAVDSGARKVSVLLTGPEGGSSPGFSYGEHEPAPGDVVAVLRTPDGARMVMRILSRDVTGGGGAGGSRVFSFFVSG